MPYTTVANGEAITPALWNTNVRDQTIARVTSSTRPVSPTEGQVIFETNTYKLGIYANGAWRLIGNYTSATAL